MISKTSTWTIGVFALICMWMSVTFSQSVIAQEEAGAAPVVAHSQGGEANLVLPDLGGTKFR